MSAHPDFTADWKQASLRELHAGGISSLDPRNFPDEYFEYYSIPAYQDESKPLIVPGREIQSQKLLIPGSCLLFGKLNPRVEKVWNVKSRTSLRKLASTEWLPIVPVEGLNQEFGYYLLRSEWVMPIAKGLVSGSTPSRERVEPKSFWEIRVPLPPLEEQKSIAVALSLLDRSIQKQNELLEKLAELKSAAMRELFTRGLRGEPQKETEIGPVPESWEVVELDRLCLATDQIDLSSEGDRTIRYIDVSSVSRDSLKVEMTSEYRLKDAPGRARKRVKAGDVIFATIRPTLLRVARIDEALNNQVCSTAFCVLRTSDSELLGKFVFYAVQRPEFLELLARIETGASYPAVTDRQVKAQPIPLPKTPEEQREIVSILDAIDRKIDLHRRKRAVLEELFKSLLHKLMTGEVRVADLDLSALPASAEATP